MEKYLPTCIESVLHQSYSDWELILVDDGSPDRSGIICDEYAQKDDRIHVIHKQNGGVAAARNMAVGEAKGDYITFVDADDYLHHDCLKDMVELAQRHGADIVQCGYVQGDETCFPEVNISEEVSILDSHQIFATEIAKIVVWGKLYKQNIIKSILIPEGRYFEDDLVTWRWYYAAEKIVATQQPYYYYTCNEESTMAQHRKKPNLSFIDAYDDRITFFRETGEKDMEDYSHRQLCNALFLSYCNPMLPDEQKKIMLERFEKSWQSIKSSPYITSKYKAIFGLFSLSPSFTKFILNTLRKN